MALLNSLHCNLTIGILDISINCWTCSLGFTILCEPLLLHATMGGSLPAATSSLPGACISLPAVCSSPYMCGSFSGTLQYSLMYLPSSLSILDTTMCATLATPHPMRFMQVALDGTIKFSGTGNPPLEKIIEDNPPFKSLRTKLSDGRE